MNLWSLIVHAAPLLALAALSPVMFLNASRITNARGLKGGLQFAAGGAGVLLVLGVAGGLLGAGAAALVQRELASKSVDVVLAVLLLGYGVFQLRRQLGTGGRSGRNTSGGKSSSTNRATASVPSGAHDIVFNGALGMATNFTSLPLFLSVAQRLGTSTEPLIVQIILLLVSVIVVALPAWLPAALAKLRPRRRPIKPATEAKVQRATGWISVGACLLGGLLIIWRVLS